jgi:autotransporter-associated beta strand protein
MRPKNSRLELPPLGVWQLEDRTLPASTITIAVGANGSGSLDSFLFDATPGIVASTDGGNGPGTLSTGALAAMSAGTSINVAAQSGISFSDIGNTLTLQTGLGKSVTFNAGTGALTVANLANTLATGGGGFTFTAGGNLSLFNLNSNGGDVAMNAGTSSGGALSLGSILTAGNITLQATSTFGGTITQTGSVSGQTVNVVAVGNVIVDALRGTTVAVTSNFSSISCVSANGIQSTGQLTLSAARGITVNTLAQNVQATNTSVGDVSITQLAAPAQALTTAGTGIRNQFARGSVTVTNLRGLVTVAAGSPVQTNNGPIILVGQDLNVAGTVNSGTGRTTLTGAAIGQRIDLGTNTPGQVGLTQGELNNVTAGVLQVGSGSTGAITISAAITAPAGWNTLALISGGDISENSFSGTLTVANLRISSGGSGFVSFANGNSFSVLAADLDGSSTFSDRIPLKIGVVDGDFGITEQGQLDLEADNLDIQQPINLGSQLLVVEPFGGIPLNLGGSDAAGVLGLTDIELGRITAGILDLIAGPGGVTISSAITRHPGYSSMEISSTGVVTQTAPVSVAALALFTSGNVTLTNPGNDVDTLAAHGDDTGINFSYRDANGFGVADEPLFQFQGISNWSSVTLTSGGAVTDANGSAINISAANLTITAISGIDLDINVATLSASLSGNGPIALSEAGSATINTLNAATGTITLDGGTFVLGGNNVISGGSTLNVAGATLDLFGHIQYMTNVRLTDGTIQSNFSGGTLLSTNSFDVRNGRISARLDGNVGLVKTTNGTVTLSGAAAYTGTTTVNGGTLLITDSVSGNTVINGGSFGGTGLVGPLTAMGGTVFPGTDGPGRLTVIGNVNLGFAAAIAAELNGPTAGPQYDQLEVAGDVSLGTAALNLTVAGGFTPSVGMPFLIIDNRGPNPVTGTFAGLPEGASVTANGLSFTISYRGGTGNDVVLTRTAAPPAVVSSVVVNAGQANLTQRSLVTSVTVTFSRPVNLVGPAADAFRLTRTGPGGLTSNVALTVDLSGSTAAQSIARLTFSGPLTEGANSLIDGNYTLTVLNSQIQGGVQGGDNISTLFRLFGDVNGDKAVDGFDLTAFRNAFGSVQGNASYVPFLDFNGDGAIDGADLTLFRNRFGVILP